MPNKIYIKNIGSTQTMMGMCPDANHVEEINLAADYDGNKANIFLKTNNNGEKHNYQFTLNEADLANMLNVDNIHMPIHKRLKTDFQQSLDPSIYRIQLPTPELVPRSPTYISEESDSSPLLELMNQKFLSSPSSSEEFIIPVRLNSTTQDNYTPRRRHMKTHNTYRVFKRAKTSTNGRRSSRRRSSRRSSRNTTH
jgi:hypothetical protein